MTPPLSAFANFQRHFEKALPFKSLDDGLKDGLLSDATDQLIASGKNLNTAFLPQGDKGSKLFTGMKLAPLQAVAFVHDTDSFEKLIRHPSVKYESLTEFLEHTEAQTHIAESEAAAGVASKLLKLMKTELAIRDIQEFSNASYQTFAGKHSEIEAKQKVKQKAKTAAANATELMGSVPIISKEKMKELDFKKRQDKRDQQAETLRKLQQKQKKSQTATAETSGNARRTSASLAAIPDLPIEKVDPTTFKQSEWTDAAPNKKNKNTSTGAAPAPVKPKVTRTSQIPVNKGLMEPLSTRPPRPVPSKLSDFTVSPAATTPAPWANFKTSEKNANPATFSPPARASTEQISTPPPVVPAINRASTGKFPATSTPDLQTVSSSKRSGKAETPTAPWANFTPSNTATGKKPVRVFTDTFPTPSKSVIPTVTRASTGEFPATTPPKPLAYQTPRAPWADIAKTQTQPHTLNKKTADSGGSATRLTAASPFANQLTTSVEAATPSDTAGPVKTVTASGLNPQSLSFNLPATDSQIIPTHHSQKIIPTLPYSPIATSPQTLLTENTIISSPPPPLNPTIPAVDNALLLTPEFNVRPSIVEHNNSLSRHWTFSPKVQSKLSSFSDVLKDLNVSPVTEVRTHNYALNPNASYTVLKPRRTQSFHGLERKKWRDPLSQKLTDPAPNQTFPVPDRLFSDFEPSGFVEPATFPVGGSPHEHLIPTPAPNYRTTRKSLNQTIASFRKAYTRTS